LRSTAVRVKGSQREEEEEEEEEEEGGGDGSSPSLTACSPDGLMARQSNIPHPRLTPGTPRLLGAREQHSVPGLGGVPQGSAGGVVARMMLNNDIHEERSAGGCLRKSGG